MQFFCNFSIIFTAVFIISPSPPYNIKPPPDPAPVLLSQGKTQKVEPSTQISYVLLLIYLFILESDGEADTFLDSSLPAYRQHTSSIQAAYYLCICPVFVQYLSSTCPVYVQYLSSDTLNIYCRTTVVLPQNDCTYTEVICCLYAVYMLLVCLLYTNSTLVIPNHEL